MCFEWRTRIIRCPHRGANEIQKLLWTSLVLGNYHFGFGKWKKFFCKKQYRPTLDQHHPGLSDTNGPRGGRSTSGPPQSGSATYLRARGDTGQPCRAGLGSAGAAVGERRPLPSPGGASGKHPRVFKYLQMPMGNLNLAPTPLPGAPLENHLGLTDQSFLGHNEGITL